MASLEADSRSRPLAASVLAEAIGAGLLLTAVVGSGIMAERLTGDEALRLLCNTLATGAALFVAITLFAPISGAHFNPAVTLVSVLQRAIAPSTGLGYLIAQLLGAVAGVWLAHAMFGEAVLAIGVKVRSGERNGSRKRSRPSASWSRSQGPQTAAGRRSQAPSRCISPRPIGSRHPHPSPTRR